MVERLRNEEISPGIEEERVGRRGTEKKRPGRRADRPTKEIVSQRVHHDQTVRQRIEMNVQRIEQLIGIQSTPIATGDELNRRIVQRTTKNPMVARIGDEENVRGNVQGQAVRSVQLIHRRTGSA